MSHHRSSNGDIFILDGKYSNPRIAYCDGNGKIYDWLNLDFAATKIRWFEDKFLVSARIRYGSQTKKVLHYFNKDGILLNDFCYRRPDWREFTKNVGGTYGSLAISNSKIFYSFSYPYEIRMFTLTGDSVFSFTREPDFYEGTVSYSPNPAVNPMKYTHWGGHCLGIVTINNNFLIAFIANHHKRKVYIDAWKINGKYLGFIDVTNLFQEISLIRSIAVSDTHLFVGCHSPYGHIKKLKIEFYDY